MTTVVITGGNRGIGLELARAYAGAGAEVVLGIRSPEAVPRVPVELHRLDVSDQSSVEAFAKSLEGRRLDILINNAGTFGPARQSSRDTDFEGFLDVLEVNTLGPLRVTQALLPNLRQSHAGKIAILSSSMGLSTSTKSDHVAYRASKAAVNKVAQCLATDLLEEGLAVAVFHPGWVRTDMGGPSADISPDESAQGVKRVIDRLSVATSGRFWNYDGSELAW
jgi:NAD(P)-dependent dehydrogenase (short-subunit alcohol dehydrogenase family)